MLSDVAEAYRTIAKKGRVLADYYIGTGHPVKLDQFFDGFKRSLAMGNEPSDDPYIPPELHGLFDVDSLRTDTNFTAKRSKYDSLGTRE